MLIATLALLGALSVVTASPVARQAQAAPPSVKLNDTVITGRRYPSFGQDVYLGIPFAQPPIGDLRWAPPQPYSWQATAFNATAPPNACSQDPAGTRGVKVSEDCLTLNVYKPALIPDGTKGLPVMVWIYGGGFTAGSTAIYNGTAIVGGSILANRPVVFVAVNYRLGIWGFAGGKEAGENHAGNLGLKDQIQALKWVQENIAAFGGDAEKVTVFGESAGAISIGLHYINPNLAKLEKPLSQRAIMQSGAPSTFPIAEISSSRQAAYDSTAKFAGCADAAEGSWACLKGLSEEALLNATVQTLRLPVNQLANFPFGPVIDHYLVPSSPQSLVQRGAFAKIPFISGNCLDEGTIFFPPTANTTEDTDNYLRLVLPKQPESDTVERLLELYPVEDVAAGSPYGTGNETFGLSPQYKRGASLVGDATFQSSRREFLEYAEQYGLNDTYSYSFEEPSPDAGVKGVNHGTDIFFTFGFVSNATGFSAGAVQVQTALIAYWINYANYGNPNGSPSAPLPIALPAWSTYDSTTDARNMLRMKAGNVTLFKDDYRQEQIAYINSKGQDLSHRK